MVMWYLLPANTTFAYTRADSLRGGNGSGRNWWDVLHYRLHIQLDTAEKSIKGNSKIEFLVTAPINDSMQIDLQQPLEVDKIFLMGKDMQFEREGNVVWVVGEFLSLQPGDTSILTIYYHGVPVAAKTPPWDGGIIWGKDSAGNAWMSVACQGLGASAWWPCKDIQSDEPDKGMVIRLNTPVNMTAVSNGKFSYGPVMANPTNSSWEYVLKNPINTYDVAFYIGDYVHWQDTMIGEKGVLNLNFYALKYNEEKARKQFAVTKQMLRCFEYWLGAYPFYEDGYKLVEAPFLGMEHQSAIAYGNQYKMGYLGRDRSNTGVGLGFDFIIIHESGHEWFGNNITARDVADNWIHEGFTTYTETLFAEQLQGKQKAYEYVQGQRLNIKNDKPVIGPYGVHQHGSGDMYDKAANLVHMIRVMMNDDAKFRKLLRGMNEKYYHSFVTSADIESYINQVSGIDFSAIFNQYLRTTNIPELEYYIKKDQLFYKFNKTVPGFTFPLELNEDGRRKIISPTSDWQSVKWKGGYDVVFPKDFYFTVKS